MANFMTFGPAEDLFNAAEIALKKMNESGLGGSDEAKILHQAVEAARESAADRVTFAREIDDAHDEYTSTGEGITIDDSPVLSVADDGVHVQAWLWVSRRPSEDEEADKS